MTFLAEKLGGGGRGTQGSPLGPNYALYNGSEGWSDYSTSVVQPQFLLAPVSGLLHLLETEN